MPLPGVACRQRSVAWHRFLIVAALVVASDPVGAQPKGLPWRIDSTAVFGLGLNLGLVSACDLGPDGSVFVLDYSNVALLRISPDGRLMWKRGKQGRGRGEFIRPTRLAVAANGEILVYDAATAELSSFSGDGEFQGLIALPLLFHQLDDIVILPSGLVAISGIVRELTNAPTDALRSSIHIFRKQALALDYVRSFGPLPDVHDPAVLRYWGSGFLSSAPNSVLLFARKLPYEVFRFLENGTVVDRITLDDSIATGPDDFIHVTREATTTRFTNSQKDVPVPARLISVGDYDLGGLIRATGRSLDVFHDHDRLISTTMPPGWIMPIGFDRRRSVLWILGAKDKHPALFREHLVFARH